MENTEIKKYHKEDLDAETTHKIAELIKGTFSRIADMYSDESTFKKQVTGGELEKILKEDVSPNVFYVLEDEKKDIVACLRGFSKETYLNPEMGQGNLFYSMYVGAKEPRKGRGSLLKKEFEQDAIQKAMENHLPALIIGRVNKKNDISMNRNIKNGYKERPEDEKSEYNQYYKEFYPKDSKELDEGKK